LLFRPRLKINAIVNAIFFILFSFCLFITYYYIYTSFHCHCHHLATATTLAHSHSIHCLHNFKTLFIWLITLSGCKGTAIFAIPQSRLIVIPHTTFLVFWHKIYHFMAIIHFFTLFLHPETVLSRSNNNQ
jgi:hypothetical protein